MVSVVSAQPWPRERIAMQATATARGIFMIVVPLWVPRGSALRRTRPPRGITSACQLPRPGGDLLRRQAVHEGEDLRRDLRVHLLGERLVLGDRPRLRPLEQVIEALQLLDRGGSP